MTQKNNITVTLTPELRLEQALSQAGIDDVASVEKLTVTGGINRDDFLYIREKMGKTLQKIDLDSATIISVKKESNKTFGFGKVTLANVKEFFTFMEYDFSGAFERCIGLKSAILPRSLEIINSSAFKGCTGLTSVVIPDSVTKIGMHAFKDCVGLKSVIIPDSVTEIGYGAFEGCIGLTSVNIPKSLVKIEHGAFPCKMNANCQNPVYATENGVLFNSEKTELIDYPAGLFGDYVIPCSVKTIGSSAFSHCYGLTSVIIPDSVTKICDRAFSGCLNLKSVIIPASATDVYYSAFDDCKACITVHPDNPAYEKGINGKLKRKR